MQDPKWLGIYLADNSTWRTSMAFGATMDECPLIDPAGGYWGTLTSGSTTQLFWPATNPAQFKFAVNMPDPAEGAVVRFFIQRAYTWSVYVNGVALTMKSAANASDLPLPTDPAGTYVFNPQLRTLWFTVRGGEAVRDILLVQNAAIQLNLHLAVSAEAFNGVNLINDLSSAWRRARRRGSARLPHPLFTPPSAVLLGISRSRIRIVQVNPGSVSATIEILDSQPTVILGSNSTTAGNATASAVQSQAAVSAAIDQTARLNSLANQVASLANAGNMNSLGGIPVLGLTLDVPPPPAAVTAALNATASSNSTGGGSVVPAFTPIAPITIVFPSVSSTMTPSQAPSPSQTLSVGASPSTSSTATSTATASPSSTTLLNAAAASSTAASPLSSGAVAGIIIGCVVAVGLAAALFFFSRPRRALKVTPSDEGDAARPAQSDSNAVPALDPTNLEREPTLTHVTVFKTPKPGAGGFDLLKGPRSSAAAAVAAPTAPAPDLRAPRRSSNCDLEPVVHPAVAASAPPEPSAPPALSARGGAPSARAAPTARLSPPKAGEEALAASAPHLESPANGIVAAASRPPV